MGALGRRRFRRIEVLLKITWCSPDADREALATLGWFFGPWEAIGFRVFLNQAIQQLLTQFKVQKSKCQPTTPLHSAFCILHYTSGYLRGT